MPARLGTLLAVLLSCQACKHRTTPNESAAVVKATTTSYPSLGRAGAFDLVSADSGAALVFAEYAQLRMTLLDPGGKARKTQLLVMPEVAPEQFDNEFALWKSLEIDEVVAATLGTRYGVVWLEHDRLSTRTRGLSGSFAAMSDSQSVSITDVQQPIATPRGNLALGSADGHFVAFARAQSSPCADRPQRDCIGYSFFEFESANLRPSGPPLAVPAPCSENALNLLLSGTRRYYGLCSLASGTPVTTWFTIQNVPSYYARADRVLEGCLPRGAVVIEDDLIVAADCAGARRAVRLRGSDQAPEELRMDRLDAVCQSGKPKIVQLGSPGLDLPLNGRQDRLEAFLPERFSLPQARAVWTGQSLLVAGVVDSKLTLKAYRCDSTLLREVALEQ